jgi:hypothetical protein
MSGGNEKLGPTPGMGVLELFRGKTEPAPNPISEETAQKILETCERLERKIDLIFGDQVYIGGKMVSLNTLIPPREPQK